MINKEYKKYSCKKSDKHIRMKKTKIMISLCKLYVNIYKRKRIIIYKIIKINNLK
jgi:hypothetical protein